ncbi:hypothetical protein Micbo1qcDRAFT_207128 [Microdochium bolleyi]|uniref:Uncharacterized protein n=1 Tax=Microdochium bolleyi TaxID=196109 RepID=A0A136IU35_9PEZI|nr:hypothetical protein Micbo1qcDRAFT_207128 [Microdochium bolleyi]
MAKLPSPQNPELSAEKTSGAPRKNTPRPEPSQSAQSEEPKPQAAAASVADSLRGPEIDVEAAVTPPSVSPTLIDEESTPGIRGPVPFPNAAPATVVFPVHSARRSPYTFLKPSTHLTTRQCFILLYTAMVSIMSTALLNFGIASAMYGFSNDDPVHLFVFPIPLAGDSAITILIQLFLTWFPTLFLVNKYLQAGEIEPIGFLPEPWWCPLRWFMFLDRCPERHGRVTAALVMRFILSQLLRVLIFTILAYAILWAPSIGVLMAVADARCDWDWCFQPRWTPQVYKLIISAVTALLAAPTFTAF